MKNQYLLSALMLIFTTSFIIAQPGIEWQKSFGGSFGDEAYAVEQTSDGGYIIVGLSKSSDGNVTSNQGDSDYWVLKLNSTGVIDWQKSYGGTDVDIPRSIQQTLDGGYIVAGYSKSNDGDVSGNHGLNDYWVLKLSSTGDIIWQKTYGGTADDFAYVVKQTTEGGYIVAGYSKSTDGDVSGNHGESDYWVVKLTSTGVISWQNSFGGSDHDIPESIQQTTDGGYILAGYSKSNDGDITNNQGNYDYWILKITDTGSLDWQKSFGGTSFDYGTAIKQTTDGGYIVAGLTLSNDGDVTGNHGNADYWVLKLTNTGAITWQKAYGGSELDYAYAINQTADGDYIVAGFSYSNNYDVSGNHGLTDYWVLKISNIGVLKWQKSMGGTGEDYSFAMNLTSDGGCIVTGYSFSNNGDVSGNHGESDFWVVKLAPDSIGVDDIFERELLNIYPNPANNQINIETSNSLVGGTYIIYDSAGKAVLSGIIDNEQTSVELDNLSIGIYEVKIKSSNNTGTSRFVKK